MSTTRIYIGIAAWVIYTITLVVHIIIRCRRPKPPGWTLAVMGVASVTLVCVTW